MKISLSDTFSALFKTGYKEKISFFDNRESKKTYGWTGINDNVMGGESSSSSLINKNGNLEFKGIVSTNNNGGFASSRKTVSKKLEGTTEIIKINLKGDGKTYQFRIKSKLENYYSYVHSFSTSGEWETIELTLDQFHPAYRGKKMSLSNFKHQSIEQISFLIGNKINEEFKLIVSKIWID
tara:strand:- start:466 stop:1008 length:543 start_codon:yes stop_codon:yes gene_type:complete